MSTTFGLVHGAWHGAWCWERLVAPLQSRDHGAVAVELPCDDSAAGLDEYADAIAAALADTSGDVVLVAHSLGGLAAPLVALRRPVSAIVYLAALVPVEGKSMADQFATSPEPVLLLHGGRQTDDAGRSCWTDSETTARLMYPDLCVADAHWAFAQLRPQAPRPQLDPCPTALPRVRVASVVCTNDRVTNPAWCRRVARDRLDVEPIELPSGHFPMIASPELLAEALVAHAA